MKSFFKPSAISLVMLVISVSSFASNHNHNQNNNNHNNIFSYFNNNNHQSLLPFNLTGVFLGFEGINIRAQNGDLDYVTIVPISSGQPVITNSQFVTKRISPSSKWTLRVYGGIKLQDNDDITVSWMELHNSDRNLTNTVEGITYLPRWLPPLFFTSGITGKVKFELDEIYGVWGHTIHFNNPWSLRFAGGVEYARIKSDLTVRGRNNTDLPPDGSFDIGFRSINHFESLGPRVELDTTYHFPCNGFAWFVRTNAALLSSARKVSLRTIDNDPDVIPNPFPSVFQTRKVVLPKLGMKIGLSYEYLFGHLGRGGCCTQLTLEAGFQADAYIHAIERPFNGDVSLEEDEVPLIDAIDRTKVSNLTTQGWFVGIKISTDWV
jgi:Legionella pneumophila major outer membrane protein precursor